jgi:hypothetical protein
MPPPEVEPLDIPPLELEPCEEEEESPVEVLGAVVEEVVEVDPSEELEPA